MEVEFYVHYFNSNMKLLDKVKTYLESGNGESITKLVLGCWENAEKQSPQEVVDYLIEKRDLLPNLKELEVGRIRVDDCDISWIELCDLGPLLMAFPALESIRIMGSRNLRLSGLNHESLKELTIVCAGLPTLVIEDIAGAELPALESLELYLGIMAYGFDATVEDLNPFMKLETFPSLKNLGLKNSMITDEIAIAMANAPILDRLESLDLSMGTLSDKGAEAILAGERFGKLKSLYIGHHYLSDKMIEKIKRLNFIEQIYEEEGDDYIINGQDYRAPELIDLDSLFEEEME